MESKRIGEEIEALLGTQTTREKSLAKKFRSNDAVKVLNQLKSASHNYNHYRSFAISKRGNAAQTTNALNFTSRR